MKYFCNLDEGELLDWVVAHEESSFRAKQLIEWVYKKFSLSFDQMTNLSKAFREQLASNFFLPSMRCKKTQESRDGETVKYLWELQDGMLIESVLIMNEEKRTLCVSSQVGCNARCAFCASGKQGLKRNLEAGEIVEQILQVESLLQEKGEKLTNIVFMGMGEPLDNFEAIIKALRIITSENMLNISKRRITISTVGVVEGIVKLAEEGLGVNLVLSLHAPTQYIRKKIIPYARKYELAEIMQAMRFYARTTKRDVTYEYILIDGINDAEEHALQLAELIKGDQCTVNLIPYNPVVGLKLQRPSTERIRAFRTALTLAGVRNTQRYTKGKDIAAACGQLALQQKTGIKMEVAAV